MTDPAWLTTPAGHRLAYHALPPAAGQPTLVWLGGFMSDMDGTKALHLDAHCRGAGYGYVRFDYFGHGRSPGAFTDGTISRWREDALAVIDALTTGPLLLIGSSMGGWIALLAALARPERVAGIIGIAAAADFTERFMWDHYSAAQRQRLMQEGILLQPSAYGPEPYQISYRLIEDGRRHLLLDAGSIPIAAPIHLLQGQRDDDVPWRHALVIADCLTTGEVMLTLVKDGDHRLSRPQDLMLLVQSVDALAARIDAHSADRPSQ